MKLETLGVAECSVGGLCSESEDEVEELEERVPSPDAAQDETSAYYDQTPW